MESSVDLTCGALGRATGDAASLHRFVVGVDGAPVELDANAIAELGDPLARLLFANGVFPTTAEQTVEELRAAVPDGDPLKTLRTFVVGEGSQLPPGTDDAGIRAFLVTCGEGPEGPDVFVSTGGPDSGFVEVMAWDATRKGFNYYQTRTADSPWVLAGNSAHAQDPQAARNGPFESHPSGNLIMKELRFPWVHWQSFAATIRADVAPELASHPWFSEASGADQLEVGAAMPAITRWTRARLAAAVDANGGVTGPRGILASFVGTPTVNLVSSSVQASLLASGGTDTLDIPHAFFTDTECLNGILGLPAIDAAQVTIPAAAYLQVLANHQVALRDGDRVVGDVPQDTHFAFVVPERAFEDIETVRAAIDIGLVSRRLAACLLMVDFPNPVFSARRAALLPHVPDSATLRDGQSTFSEDVANAIRTSNAAGREGTPEREFADLWDSGEAWPDHCAALLTAYYGQVAAKLSAPDGLGEVFRLAESRRNQVRAMPIHEHPLLFATPDPPIGIDLRMTPSGEIVVA